MQAHRKDRLRPLLAGLPTGFGNFCVSFAYGVIAYKAGLPLWVPVIISLTSPSTAGRFAGTNSINESASYIILFILQVFLYIQYAFMSVPLMRKLDGKKSFLRRAVVAHFHVDEVFSLAMKSDEPVNNFTYFSLAFFPYIGWATGTIVGWLLGGILPVVVVGSLGIVAYASMVAAIVPRARRSKGILVLTVSAALLALACAFLPYIKELPSGLTTVIVAVVISLIVAYFFPIKKEEYVV